MNSITQFFISTNPPRYGHQLNACETIGNAILFPFASSVGTFYDRNATLSGRIWACVAIVFSLPLTLIGAIIKGVGTAWPHEEILATDAAKTPTSSMKLRQCYDLAAVMKRVFMENGLVRESNGEEMPAFVMVSGTALGAVRHKGIIPWDDDCDFAIFSEDEERFLKIKDAFKKEGIEIRDMRFDSTYKFRFSDEKLKELYGDNVSSSDTGENDLFVWSKMPDGRVTYDAELSRARWWSEYFTQEDMERGFEMVEFGPPEKGLTLPMLIGPHEYLARYYGDNYKDFGIETHGHLHFDFGCGSINIPFLKFGAHYFKIEASKGIPAPWEGNSVVADSECQECF